MSYRNNDDWDVCWYYLSSTGCRNSNCKWRHERSAGQLYSNRYHKRRSTVGCYRGDPKRKPGAPFYPIKQHKDGGVEDQYGLVHYPDIDDEYSVKFKIQMLRKRANRRRSEHGLPFFSPMSTSSCKTSAPNSSATSVKTAHFESDSDCDIMNNVMFGSTYEGRKVRKLLFSKSVPKELSKPRHQQKMEMNNEKAITSVLSPLAKVFVPSMDMLESPAPRVDGFREYTNESRPMSARQQLVTRMSSGSIVDEVEE